MKELKISEYSFHEFLSTFQQAVIDGFRLDLDSNERFPQKFGSHMEVTLVTPEEVLTEEVPEAVANPEAEAEVPVVKTRKGK